MTPHFDQELFDSARAAGAAQGRSAEQQLDYWARLGRALEASPSVTQEALTRALSGESAYDDLPDSAQAAVRVTWDERMAAVIDDLDFTDRLNAAGKPWAEADEDGNLVIREALGRTLPSRDVRRRCGRPG